MSDASGQPPEGDEAEPEFRDDALSELMTGAFAATSMVSMSVRADSDLPAPPVWSPSQHAPPKAEVLDEGQPSRLQSGPHASPQDIPDITVEEDGNDALPYDLSEAFNAPVFTPPAKEPERDRGHLEFDDFPEEDDEAEPAAAISTASGVIVTHQHAKGAQLTGAYPTLPTRHRSPAPAPARSILPWVGAGVLVAAALAAFLLTRGGEATPGGHADAETSPITEASEASVMPQSSVPASPEVSPTPPLEPAAPDPARTYADASERYERDQSNDALLDMTVSACQLGHGPDARSAFRKLIGSTARSEAVVECREVGIDVSANVEGFTEAELAAQARTALDAGDAEKALDLAKQSNRTSRNQRALQLIVKSHCKLGQTDDANKMLRHVTEKRRPQMARYCKSQGVKLR